MRTKTTAAAVVAAILASSAALAQEPLLERRTADDLKVQRLEDLNPDPGHGRGFTVSDDVLRQRQIRAASTCGGIHAACPTGYACRVIADLPLRQRFECTLAWPDHAEEARCPRGYERQNPGDDSFICHHES